MKTVHFHLGRWTIISWTWDTTSDGGVAGLCEPKAMCRTAGPIASRAGIGTATTNMRRCNPCHVSCRVQDVSEFNARDTPHSL